MFLGCPELSCSRTERKEDQGCALMRRRGRDGDDPRRVLRQLASAGAWPRTSVESSVGSSCSACKDTEGEGKKPETTGIDRGFVLHIFQEFM